MVTIQKKIDNTKRDFIDTTASRLDYERSVQGLEDLKPHIARLEKTLKEETGFHDYNLPPEEGALTHFETPSVTFTVDSIRKTKRPSYKDVVENVERDVKQMKYLMGFGIEMDGFMIVGGDVFVDANVAYEWFTGVAESHKKEGVTHTITYTVDGRLKSEGTPEHITPNADMGEATTESFNEYVRLDRVKDDLEEFKTTYEDALSEGKEAVNLKDAYKKESHSAQGPDWAYVATTLMGETKADGEEGELELLADGSIDFSEKREEQPFYELRELGGKTYISLKSIYDRVQDLKDEKAVTAERETVEHRVIV